MNLQQLRYLDAIRRAGLNISQAAERLHTSQPGISRQVRALEDELGVEIFERTGRNLARVTAVGERVLRRAEIVLDQVAAIRGEAEQELRPNRGVLSIATTHTQARYALPGVVRTFRTAFPEVQIHLHQAASVQIAKMIREGEVDIAIATEGMEFFEEFVMMPCYQWNHCVVTPHGHPLHVEGLHSLEQVASYPLLGYVLGFTGHTPLGRAFNAAGIAPNVVFSATDADVIKTYIKLGLGIGIMSRMAFDEVNDKDLVRLDAAHLIERGVTKIGIRRGFFLKRLHLDFIQMFAPHLTPSVVRRAQAATHEEQRKWLFVDEALPLL